MGDRTPRSVGDEKGAILLVIVLLIGILAALAMIFVIQIRSHTKLTSNLIDAAKAEVAANSGVRLAQIALLTRPISNVEFHRPSTTGLSAGGFACRIDDATVSVTIQDEGGKVDLNAASEELLELIFTTFGLAELDSQELVQRTIDYRDADDVGQDGLSEKDRWLESGFDYAPFNGPFVDVDQFHEVLGDIRLVGAHDLRNFFTVYSRRNSIDLSKMTPQLRRLLNIEDNSKSLQSDFQQTTLNRFLGSSPEGAFRVLSTATTPSGSIFVRDVILVRGDGSMQLKSWRQAIDVKNRPILSETRILTCNQLFSLGN